MICRNMITATIILLLFFVKCKDSSSPETGTNNKSSVKLENQDDHSGIMFHIVELDTILTTNHNGQLIYSTLLDGNYTVNVGYPYFKLIHVDITVINGEIDPALNVNLKQQVRFWIEPAETTITLYGDFSVRLYAENKTDSLLLLAGYNEPLILRAFSPSKHEWPYVSGKDSFYCEFTKGLLIKGDLTHPVSTIIEPAKISSFLYRCSMFHPCFLIGEYELYLTLTDLSRYPLYFEYERFEDLSNPEDLKYLAMNKSLLLKRNLVKPAILYIAD